MKAWARLLLILAGAALLASAGTQLFATALGIRRNPGAIEVRYGGTERPAGALIFGSSLTYSGIDWKRVAAELGVPIATWPVPGSSPAEWEQIQRRSSRTRITFVGLSVYDLNEESLCDFRANLVPFTRTVGDAWESGLRLPYARRMLSFYAVAWLRPVFPMAGRSDQAIFGLRDAARKHLGAGSAAEADAAEAPLMVAPDVVPREKVSDWPKDRFLRRMAVMKSSQGRPWFSGPKHEALVRLLGEASRRGKVVVLVLPVSPPFTGEVLSQSDVSRFEASLSEARQAASAALWIRLDENPALRSSDCFSDFVHMNMHGRAAATPALLSRLASATTHP